MVSRKKLALVILPDNAISKEVVSTAEKWIESGLIDDFAYSTPALLGDDFTSTWKLQVRDASEGLAGNGYDLLELLGRSQPDRLEVVTPWILGNAKADTSLLGVSSSVVEVLNGVLSQRVDPITGKAIRPLASISMAIYPFHSEFGSEAERAAASIRTDLVVVCSPEVRAQPWAASAPLQGDGQFVPFAIAQISAVCGLWSGFSDSIFAIIDNSSDQLAVAQPLVIRTIGSVVVAEGVAERIVIEALRTAALPDQSPFQISTDPGSGRPQAISSLQIDLINAELERYLNQILSIRQNGFTYDAISRDFELDQRRGFLDALRKFGIFSLKAITNIPIFIWQGWKNFGSAVANRLLGQVRPSYPEIYSGLDKEVRDLQLTLRAYLTDDGKIAQNAATTASFKQEPEVWRELREISLGALDGGTSVRSKSVLPLVNNIYPDPESIIKLDASSFQGLDNLPSELSPLELYEFRRTITGSVKDLDLRIQELYVTLEEHRAAEEVSENEDADPIEGFDSIEIEHSEAIDDVPVDESIKQDAQFESAPIDAKPTSDPGATVKAETQDEGTSTSAAIEDSDETPATAQPMSLELVGGQTSVKAGPSSVSYEEPRVKRRSTPQKKLDQTPTVETKLESQSENDS